MSDAPLIVGLLRSVSVFRAVALVGAIGGAALSTDHLEHPVWGVGAILAMIVVTGLVTMWPGRSAVVRAASIQALTLELVAGVAVLLADGLVYGPDRAQSLPWSWPAAGIIVAGITLGKRAGLAAALVVGSASLVSEVALLGRDSGFVGSLSKLGLWVIAGVIAGYVTERLRRAEAEISSARAREEVARTLHDGVLQTLAVIQRRSDDPELAALAREQEHDLRGYLAGTDRQQTRSLEVELRALTARHSVNEGHDVRIVVAPDLPAVPPVRVDAITGAVGEALTNVVKHADASKVTIYAEPDDDDDDRVVVSVKDDGAGFDVDSTSERIGLSRSIRGRVEEHEGRIDVRSRPGRGTEIRLWV